jgi:hypothetical protein
MKSSEPEKPQEEASKPKETEVQAREMPGSDEPTRRMTEPVPEVASTLSGDPTSVLQGESLDSAKTEEVASEAAGVSGMTTDGSDCSSGGRNSSRDGARRREDRGGTGRHRGGRRRDRGTLRDLAGW